MNPVDQVLEQYQLKPMKYYHLGMLYTIMNELGLVAMNRRSFTRDWFYRKVRSRKLILPEKPLKAHWQLTGHQIRRIVICFAPGGAGRYDYREEL